MACWTRWQAARRRRLEFTGYTLQIGKSSDGKGYLPNCPADPCCLSTHYDVVPDGDGGWSLVVAVTVVSLLYICGGLHLGRKRGLCTHIHIEQARQGWGLAGPGWLGIRSLPWQVAAHHHACIFR